MKILLDIKDLQTTLMYCTYIKEKFPEYLIKNNLPDINFPYLIYMSKWCSAIKDREIFIKSYKPIIVDNYPEFIKLLEDDNINNI